MRPGRAEIAGGGYRTGPPSTPVGGFTLAEVVVVLAIIAVVSVIAVPRFASSQVQTRLRSAADRIVQDVEYARRFARARGASVTMTFNVAASRYLVAGVANLDFAAGSYVVRLRESPYEVTVQSADFGGNADLVFDGYGVPDSGGTVRLSAGASSIEVTLDAASGRASRQ